MAGVYIHIPFCAKRCSYCDFHFSTSYGPYKSNMIGSIIKELKMRAENEATESVQTIYFGGGTPSLLFPEEVQLILNAVKSSYDIEEACEITLECNPDDCSFENLTGWKNVGVNRLSIGIQSFTDEQLGWMNRTHNAHEGVEAVKRAKLAGFTNLTVDLIYGLPGLSAARWMEQLERVLELGVNHISAYCLTVESKTPLADWVKSGKIHPADADLQSEHFELLVAKLEKEGFEQYEISNFARSGHFSRHNSAYWKGEKYISVGPSAHGYDGKNRYWNVANNKAYMKQIESGALPQTVEELTANDRFNELLLTGLRTKWGVDKQRLLNEIQPDTNWYDRVESWKLSGNLIETDSLLLLTPQGKLLADGIASDLFLV